MPVPGWATAEAAVVAEVEERMGLIILSVITTCSADLGSKARMITDEYWNGLPKC